MKRLFSVFFGLVLCCANVSAQNNPPKIVDGGVINDKAVSLVKPEFPPAAKAVQASGAVQVQVIINEEGNVISAESVSGHPLLRKASEDAALASKFSPTRLSGQLVKVSGIIVYNFVAGNNKTAEVNTNEFRYSNNIHGDVLNGKAVKLPKPAYPPAAKAVNASGMVTVKVTISEDGNVISAQAVSGHPLLLASSENAAREAKFEPYSLNEKPVKVTGIIVYNFTSGNDPETIKGEEKPTDCRIRGGVINEKARKLPQPEYPPAAKAVKAGGTVSVKVTIDETGNVISAEAVSGHPLLRPSAENAAKEAKFSPTFLSGQPVKVTGVIVYNFTLPDKTKK